MQRAEAADAAAFADARESGGKDPGPKNVDKLRADLAEMTRVAQGLHETIERTDTAFRAAVAAEKDRLAADTLAAAEKIRTAVVEKANELLDLSAELDRLHRMARWLDGGPSTAGRAMPLSSQVHGSSIGVDELIGFAADALAQSTSLEKTPAAVVNEHPDMVPHGAQFSDPAETMSARRKRGPGASLREDEPVG